MPFVVRIKSTPLTLTCRTHQVWPLPSPPKSPLTSPLPPHCILATVAVSLSLDCPRSAWFRVSDRLSAWICPPPLKFSHSLHMVATFSSRLFQFSCYLLREAFPDHPTLGHSQRRNLFLTVLPRTGRTLVSLCVYVFTFYFPALHPASSGTVFCHVPPIRSLE